MVSYNPCFPKEGRLQVEHFAKVGRNLKQYYTQGYHVPVSGLTQWALLWTDLVSLYTEVTKKEENGGILPALSPSFPSVPLSLEQHKKEEIEGFPEPPLTISRKKDKKHTSAMRSCLKQVALEVELLVCPVMQDRHDNQVYEPIFFHSHKELRKSIKKKTELLDDLQNE